MRRSMLIVIAACAVGAAAVPSSAGTSRTVVRDYQLATSSVTDNSTVTCCGLVVDGTYYGMAVATARAGERYVSLALADDTTGPVAGVVSESANGKRYGLGVVCGSTAKPLRLPVAGGRVVVRPAYGACGTTPSTPTTGTVTFRFTR